MSHRRSIVQWDSYEWFWRKNWKWIFFSRRYFAKYVEEMYLNACCSSGTIICLVKTESINLFGVPVARNRRVSLNSSSTHPNQTQENRQETMFSFKWANRSVNQIFKSDGRIVCLFAWQVSAKCASHVQRVMHQRAVDVHLMPEIQMNCIQDLAQHCNDRLNNGEVMTIIMISLRPSTYIHNWPLPAGAFRGQWNQQLK